MMAAGLSLPLGSYQHVPESPPFPLVPPGLCGAWLWLSITLPLLPHADGSSYPRAKFRRQQTIEEHLLSSMPKQNMAWSSWSCPALFGSWLEVHDLLQQRMGTGWEQWSRFWWVCIFFRITVIMCFMYFDVWLMFWCLRFYCEWFE